jgi:hypothetical protein
MRQRLAVGIVVVVLCAWVTGARADIMFVDDFSAGLDPAFWRVQKSSTKYVVDASQGDVRLSSSGLTGRGYQYVQVYFKGQVVGDFDMRIHFRNANLALIDYFGQAANQVSLHAQFGGQHFNPTRDIAAVEGDNYHVYLNPPGQTVGVTPTTVLEGAFRILRIGNTYSGWFDNHKIYEATYANSTPSDLWFSLENNQTNDAISVTFDDFSINAQNILGIPEPGCLGVVAFVAVAALIRPRRARAAVIG